MADDLLEGLPPPSAPPLKRDASRPPQPQAPPPLPAPPLKSALKREKTSEPLCIEEVPQKKLRFKTSVDATERQVIEAMQKIASHIINPSKFSKASKLAIQLVQAGSVKSGTSDFFFAILQAAMSLPSGPTDPALRSDYHSLFSTAQEIMECFNDKQRSQMVTWTISAVYANDLYTDDSFVFSKTAGKIKEAIDGLPTVTAMDDTDEAASLSKLDKSSAAEPTWGTSDPFGLDALLSSNSKLDSKSGREKAAFFNPQFEEDEESKRFLKSQREALLLCLEIAAKRYRIAWTQTVIDILVKHAFQSRGRFTRQQREAIEKLWSSIRDQHIRRKQGKSASGKLDVSAFERLQEKYAGQKISIRHAVGGGGERKAEQWLG